MASSELSLERIGQISVAVEDLERAVAFYRDVLGMRFLFKAPPGLAFFDCGGVRLMLSPNEENGQRFHTSIIYYKVDDIHAAAKTLEQRGVRFEQPPHLVAKLPDHELWLCGFRDSENNLLELMSEVPVG